MQPALPRLRSMNATDVIDAAFKLYRRNFVLFAGVVAVLLIPQTALTMVVTALSPVADILPGGTCSNFSGSNPTSQQACLQELTSFFTGGRVASWIGALILLGLIGFVFNILITGTLAQAISDRYLGLPTTPLDAYRRLGVHRFVVLLAATLALPVLALVALAVVAIVGGLVTYLLAQMSAAYAVVFAIAAVFGGSILAVWTALHFAFVSQVVVLEQSGVFRAYRRSWGLVSGSWWRVAGVTSLVFFLVLILNGIVGTIVQALFAFSVLPAGVSAVLQTGVSGAVGIFIQPVQLGTLTLLYYDLRIRREGFDLEFRARNLESGLPA